MKTGGSGTMIAPNKHSDEDLGRVEKVIIAKLAIAKSDFAFYKSIITNSDANGVHDTSPSFKVLEEGAATLSKEEAGRSVERLDKFIKNLEAALARIKNKTYGVCRETGQLIPIERLIAVPHTTLCVEMKN